MAAMNVFLKRLEEPEIVSLYATADLTWGRASPGT
jgi:hypothetical protein